MTYVGKKPADIIATAVDTTTGTFSGDLTVDTSTLFVDSANNSVGIGTVSPLAGSKLDVIGQINARDNERISLVPGANPNDPCIIETGGGSPIAFSPEGTEAMRIDTSGRVGIGTSPGYKLDVDVTGSALRLNSTTSQALLVISSDDSANAKIEFGDESDNDRGAITYDNPNNAMLFQTNTSEAMRIDSSGNLLVGKTSSGTSVQGAELRESGFNAFTRDTTQTGEAVLLLNKKNNDGVIQFFQKNTSTVGSIGYESTGLYIDGEANHAGFTFRANAITSRQNGSEANGAISLGNSTARFSDLYLSGGAYLGGTGSANYLDDYEEGTFTPTVASTGTNPTVTYSMQEGNYTKIGRQVTITAEIRFSAYTDNGGSFRLEGIPFSVFGDTNYRAVGSIALAEMAVNLTGDYSVLQLAWNSGNSMQVIQNNSVTSGDAETPTSKIDAGTRIRYQITYFTT